MLRPCKPPTTRSAHGTRASSKFGTVPALSPLSAGNADFQWFLNISTAAWLLGTSVLKDGKSEAAMGDVFLVWFAALYEGRRGRARSLTILGVRTLGCMIVLDALLDFNSL